MLIRLANHAVLNPHLIDKMIVVRGLPHDWIFKTTPQGEQLLAPWLPDVDENIPDSVRPLCQKITYCRWFPDVRHYDRTYTGFWDTQTCWGLKLDFNYGPAITMWQKVTDFIEGTLPRTERMPQPVLVATDHRSNFNPQLSRRDAQGHLEMTPAQVPVIDLSPFQKLDAPTVTVASAPEPQFEMKKNVYVKCDQCGYESEKPQALRLHKIRKHPKREKVTA